MLPRQSEATGFLLKLGRPYYQEMMLLQDPVGGTPGGGRANEEESCPSCFLVSILFLSNKMQGTVSAEIRLQVTKGKGVQVTEYQFLSPFSALF